MFKAVSRALACMCIYTMSSPCMIIVTFTKASSFKCCFVCSITSMKWTRKQIGFLLQTRHFILWACSAKLLWRQMNRKTEKRKKIILCREYIFLFTNPTSNHEIRLVIRNNLEKILTFKLGSALFFKCNIFFTIIVGIFHNLIEFTAKLLWRRLLLIESFDCHVLCC